MIKWTGQEMRFQRDQCGTESREPGRARPARRRGASTTVKAEIHPVDQINVLELTRRGGVAQCSTEVHRRLLEGLKRLDVTGP